MKIKFQIKIQKKDVGNKEETWKESQLSSASDVQTIARVSVTEITFSPLNKEMQPYIYSSGEMHINSITRTKFQMHL